MLALCTGNSCRSQMAEAILNQELAGQVRALSAGTRPQANVAERALEALTLAGVPTAGLYAKDIEAVINEPIDVVVTVCDNAKESCPIFPRPVPRTTWKGTPLHELCLKEPDGNLIEVYARLTDVELAEKPADELPEFLVPGTAPGDP